MDPVVKQSDIGVIIGRFQVDSLHEGQKALFDTVLTRHNKVMVLLGSTPGVLVTRRQPMDFMTRKLMLEEVYGNRLIILPIHDMPSDIDWSAQVDSKVVEAFGDHVTANLYGSRDSFIPHYKGRFNPVELQDSVQMSGTEVRQAVSDEVRESPDFRKGVIYAAYNRHPIVYSTVDIVIWDDYLEKIVLGRKPTDPINVWRFPGGFLDPTKDKCLEDAARREASEEVGNLEFDTFDYLTSIQINDWRYRNEADCIISSVFETRAKWGAPQGKDDLAEAKWFDLDKVTPELLVPGHRPILDKILEVS